jgi:hypothetical protein
VVLVEVRGQELAVLVVGEGLVEGRAQAVSERAVDLALDDLRVDAHAAVVDRRVVDHLDDARVAVDLDHASVDLRRVRQRQVAVLALLVGQLERRHVHVPAVEGDVACLGREHRVVGVHDRTARHERKGRLGVVLEAGRLLLEDDVVRRRAEDGGGEPPDLERELLGRALDRLQARDRELARVRAGEAGVRVPVAVVAGAHVDVVG